MTSESIGKPFRRLFVELLIVVFGILIAFAVDRWNQDRQDRNTAAQYMAALADDLSADTAALTALVGVYRGREEAAQRVLDALEGSSNSRADAAALAWDINSSGYVTSFEPNDFTYRELVSTRRLALIRSPDLKRALVAYHQKVAFYAQFRPLWQETARAHYIPEVRRRVTPADWLAIETSQGRDDDRPVSVEATLRALRADGLVPKLLVSIMTALEQQQGLHESLRADAVDVLNLLSSR